MRLRTTLLVFLALAVASGCEAPVSYTELPLTPYDKNTRYRVDDSLSGFTLYLDQAQYQFILNDAILASCTQAIKKLAHEIGERRGHTIEIDGERVKMSFGRNGVNGISSCSAMVPVGWSDGERHLTIESAEVLH
jgi:hypothetical protein